jgi:hypothetical protein
MSRTVRGVRIELQRLKNEFSSTVQRDTAQYGRELPWGRA